MKRYILIFLLLGVQCFGAFTEFYCDPSTGSNLNGGGNEYAVKTYTSQIVAGGWNSATGVFTVASGSPSGDGVAVGDFASVYVTAGATVGTFIGRVTARDTTTITVSLTAVSGAPPATDALGATTIKLGGKWKGPNGAQSFPFNFMAATMTNSSGDYPRANLVAGTYTVTAGVTNTIAGPCRFQGYTGSPGDGGRAIIDGTGIGSSVTILSNSAVNNDFADITVANNGTSSAQHGFSSTALECSFIRCVAHDIRGSGFNITQAGYFEACEAYTCNTSNTASLGGFTTSGVGSLFVRCISHDNSTNTNCHGFVASALTIFTQCIADTNGGSGFLDSATTSSIFYQCDAYNNTSDGATLSGASAAQFTFENCNFFKNGGWGINSSGSTIRNGAIRNCVFGAGTQINTSGDTTGTGGMNITGSITYASNATPYAAPTTGDFDITGTTKASGYGVFTQTQASYTGTLAVPAVGASQQSSSVAQVGYSQ